MVPLVESTRQFLEGFGYQEPRKGEDLESTDLARLRGKAEDDPEIREVAAEVTHAWETILAEFPQWDEVVDGGTKAGALQVD